MRRIDPNQPFEVVHRDADLLVLDKPSGVALFADRTGAPCLWDALKKYLGDTPPLPVHRLDKGTSGVLLIALSAQLQADLNRCFAARTVRKHYLARVRGRFAGARTIVIDLPLKKGRKSRYRVAAQRADIRRIGQRFDVAHASRDGLESVTRVRCIRADADSTLLAALPLTGRTHQLRVHLAWIGHPILGDHLYGKPADAAQQWPRLALHCHRIVLPDGVGTFVARPPTDL